MKKRFLYNILQYHHSLILNESINIGILFVFPDDNIVQYIPGNIERVKLIYPNFNSVIVDRVIKGIFNKISAQHKSDSLFNALLNKEQLEEHQRLLRSDDSSLQFTNSKTAIYPFDDFEKIIKEYSTLLLPTYSQKKEEEDDDKNDEQFILKTFTKYLYNKLPNSSNLVSKNRVIESNGIKLKFDYAWQNGSLNLVKPISFDLKKEQLIQTKSITYFGYLTKLRGYAFRNNARYDLLVSEPKNKEFIEEYNKALETIESAQAPIKIITQEKLEEYSEEAAFYLSKKLDFLDDEEVVII